MHIYNISKHLLVAQSYTMHIVFRHTSSYLWFFSFTLSAISLSSATQVPGKSSIQIVSVSESVRWTWQQYGQEQYAAVSLSNWSSNLIIINWNTPKKYSNSAQLPFYPDLPLLVPLEETWDVFECLCRRKQQERNVIFCIWVVYRFGFENFFAYLQAKLQICHGSPSLVQLDPH